MEALSRTLRAMLARCVGIDAAQLDAAIPFVLQGVGARELAEFGRQVELTFGRPAPNLLWECASIAALSQWVASDTSPCGAATARELGFVAGLPDPAYYE